MRARLLKPGFFSNEELARLPVRARLLFAGLWGLADREGRLEDRPQRIKAAIFPYDRVNVEPLLQALSAAGFVKRYTVAYTRCLALPTFATHQHPHHHEPPSLLPPPPTLSGHVRAGLGPRPPDPVLRSGTDPDLDQDQDPPRALRSAGSPSASRPAYMPPFKAYCAIAKRVVQATPDADLSELAELFKCACAKQRIPYDGDITRKAIDAVINARRRRA
jgi:hypothetical protein